jgi:sigma-B regulation protein RsbU (phosphoserine phosphatase)
VAICIADVCGKGLPAALMMANLQAAVRTCAARGMRPKDLCVAVNRVMCENMAAQGFITFFYGILEAGARRISYCNAGHNPPPLGTVGGIRRLDRGGGVLGIFPDWPYEEEEVILNPGDRLLLYTDGITESRNAADEEFGEERLLRFMQSAPHADAAALSKDVIRAATEFNNGRFDDDLTVVAVTID